MTPAQEPASQPEEREDGSPKAQEPAAGDDAAPQPAAEAGDEEGKGEEVRRRPRAPTRAGVCVEPRQGPPKVGRPAPCCPLPTPLMTADHAGQG